MESMEWSGERLASSSSSSAQFQEFLHGTEGGKDYVAMHSILLNFTFVPGYENATAFHQTAWVDIDTISITLVANLVLCVLALIYFWSSRRHHPGYFSHKRAFLPDLTPPDLPTSGFLSWIPVLMAMSEEEIVDYAGFDAAIFLRFYHLAFKVFALFTPYALFVLVPVNITGVNSPRIYPYTSNINTFNSLSMSNVPMGDRRMWLHAMGMYLLTGISMYFLVIEYRYYTNLRHKFLRRKSPYQRTIVVEGVPKEMRSDSKLFTYFNTLYPDEVVNVHIPMDLTMLRRLIRKRQAVLMNLERAIAEKGIRGEEQYHYTGYWCWRRRRVNTVGHYTQELEKLNLAIVTEQDKRIPRRRRRPGWGPALTSISSVDMSYDLDAIPDREVGPIERVVLQEDLEALLSESEASSEARANSSSNDGGPNNSDGDGDSDGSKVPAALAVKAAAGSGTSSSVGGRGPKAGEDATARGLGGEPDSAAAAMMSNGHGSYDGYDGGRATNGTPPRSPPPPLRARATPPRSSPPPSRARTTATVSPASDDDQMEHRAVATPFSSMEAGVNIGLSPARDGKQSAPRRAGSGNVTSSPEQAGAYRRQSEPTSTGGGGGGRAVRVQSASPKGRATGSAGLGWGVGGEPRVSKLPASGSTLPRLSVDLINVDPVGEAVRHTAKTIHKNMREKSFHYRNRSYGATAATSAKNGNDGSQDRLLGNGKQTPTIDQGMPTGNPVVPNDPSLNVSIGGGGRLGRSFGHGFGYLWGGGDGVAATAGGESSMLLMPSRRMSLTRKTGPRYSSRAFVTFRSFSAATVARQVLHCARPGRMAASSAPEARDIYWPNAIVTRRQHTVRRLVVEIVLGALMIFFPVLVTLLSFSFSAENLMQRSGVIKMLCGRSSLFQSMVELIQPMMVIAVMATLPVLLRWVGHFEGILAESMIQMQTLSRYFSFQVLNVFLVTTIARFAVEILTRHFESHVLKTLAEDPYWFFTLLGDSLPKVCGFFCDYVIIRAFSGMSMELVRAYNLFPALVALLTCKSKWSRPLVASSAEERRYRFDSSASNASPVSGVAGSGLQGHSRMWPSGSWGSGSGTCTPTQTAARTSEPPQCFYYGQFYAQDLLVVVVVMTYACVAPVVLIPALMFFFMAQIVYRHQLLYVYVPKFESGGSFFPKMFRRWIFALFTAQATMIGMCVLKDGVNEACSVMFLMVLTYAFKRKVRAMYEPVSFSLPLEIARGLDMDQAESGLDAQEEDEALHPAAQEYLQPELREPAILGPEDLLSAIGGNDETFGQ